MQAMVVEWRRLALCLAALGADAGGSAEAVAATVPLCPGLQIVTAISEPNGDYESIKSVESVSPEAIRIKYSSERLVTDYLAADFGQVKRTTIYRSLPREDLRSAKIYQQRFFEDMPETIPGSTAIGTSSDALEALKSIGKVELSISNAYAGGFPADRGASPSIYDFLTPGWITRARPEPVMLSVMVNDARTELPAIHATGDFAGEASEFFFLDDPGNPMTLKFRIGIDAVPPMGKEMVELCLSVQGAAPAMAEALCGKTERSDSEALQVVKITYRCAPPEPREAATAESGAQGGAAAGMPSPAAVDLADALVEGGTVAIYDIHFSFNSDEIREESAPRLQEIAEVLTRHPAWRLGVHGHTDSIASDAYNLELSERRAAAVKNALVTRYGIDPARLATAGLGETQPRDSNDTLEGRARNRRVELVKQ
jgi:outer membrane protein OmpA-like peptidoglycan-associated protein